MKKSNQDIDVYFVNCSDRTSEDIEKIAVTVYSVASGACETSIQCCEKTYEDFLVEGTNVLDGCKNFDWYLFPCHCGSEDRLNFDPLKNKHDANFFLHFCRCFEKGPRYSKEQIGNAPDIRMAICKKAIDQWFDPKRNEKYWIRLLKILQHLDYTLRSLMILEASETYQYFEFILKEICLPHFQDINDNRYKELYTQDKNYNDNIAFLNYLSQEFSSIQKSGISDEKKILRKAYDNVFNNIRDGEGKLKKGRFHVQRNDTAGESSSSNLDKKSDLDKKADVNNKKEKLQAQEKIKNQTSLSKINIKKGKKKNKVSVWQHFLFGLFLFFACLSLFLCFKISLPYFVLPFVICFSIDLYLGFKNYCRGCCCIQQIETPVIDQNRDSLVTIDSNEPNQNLIDGEINIQ